MDRARRALFESGLFAKVTVGHAGEVTDGSLPMTVTLTERDHRTARAGLTYSTDFGPGVNLGWEHRNYFGKGESLKADLSVNAVKRGLEASLSKPRFMGAEQELMVKTSLADEDSDAFDSRGLDVSAIVERDVRGLFSVGYGGGYRYSRVKDEDEEETDTFGHAYVPLAVARDKRNSVLDPSKGYRVNVQAAPYMDTLGSGANFLIYRLSGSLYHELLDERRAVLAARAMFGAITGAGREQVPADLRLYAGGGGTVRGYAYQTAGELDEDDEPVGGKSMISAGLEARFKISENMGFSPFLDVGRAYEQGQPDLDKELFWGAGVGFQYYTGFGPVRVDVAVPLNPRSGVDDSFQIYMSLGQSF
jgi:translocation and assembly module TamA